MCQTWIGVKRKTGRHIPQPLDTHKSTNDTDVIVQAKSVCQIDNSKIAFVIV